MSRFHEYASGRLEDKKAGVLGERPIGPHTEADYRSHLANHLLPYFGRYLIGEITADDCLAFKGLVAHVDALRRVGLPTDPDAYLFCNRRGGRLQRQKVNRSSGRPPYGRPPPGTARSPPASQHHAAHAVADLHLDRAACNDFDVLWVMRQVGHADSKMTMDVYAQLQHRAERSHGEAFDALVRRARERL